MQGEHAKPFIKGPRPPSDLVDFDLQLRIGLTQVRISASITPGPTSLPEFLPVLHSLTDTVMAATAREAKRERRSISCRPGCGACCRQLVPVAEAEALYLKGLLNSLEQDHQARVRKRFSIAVRRIAYSGLLERLRSAGAASARESRRALGLNYFHLGIPCPFLEQESCSIHPHRPLACREYLVTSDPSHCASPDAAFAETLELPTRPSALFYRFGDGADRQPPRWLALPLAIEWAETNGVKTVQQGFVATELFERFVRRLVNAKTVGMDSPGIKQG